MQVNDRPATGQSINASLRAGRAKTGGVYLSSGDVASVPGTKHLRCSAQVAAITAAYTCCCCCRRPHSILLCQPRRISPIYRVESCWQSSFALCSKHKHHPLPFRLIAYFPSPPTTTAAMNPHSLEETMQTHVYCTYYVYISCQRKTKPDQPARTASQVIPSHRSPTNGV